MREFALIDQLRATLSPVRSDTGLGIGDDAAILAPPVGQELVVTTDTLIAGRHFHHDAAAADIGYKAIGVNLSDIAAMGASPAWLTVSLAAPELDAAWCRDLVAGMQMACRACPCEAPVDIVGGDTTASDTLTISITAIGHVSSGMAVRRAGARPGDLVVVTGTLGDAAAGLALWAKRDEATTDEAWLIQRLLRPDLRRGSALIGHARSAIDVSDGLLADLSHILRASGCGARIRLDDLPASDALVRCVPDTPARWRLQATGGDDYELCATVGADDLPALREALDCPVHVIGEIVAEPGLVCLDAAGRALDSGDWGEAGWDHFA